MKMVHLKQDSMVVIHLLCLFTYHISQLAETEEKHKGCCIALLWHRRKSVLQDTFFF